MKIGKKKIATRKIDSLRETPSEDIKNDVNIGETLVDTEVNAALDTDIVESVKGK